MKTTLTALSCAFALGTYAQAATIVYTDPVSATAKLTSSDTTLNEHDKESYSLASGDYLLVRIDHDDIRLQDHESASLSYVVGDGDTSSLQVFLAIAAVATWNPNTVNFGNYTIDLANYMDVTDWDLAAQFDDAYNNGRPLEFLFRRAPGATSNPTVSEIEHTAEGTPAVPEPAAALLGSFGGLLLMRRRRAA